MLFPTVMIVGLLLGDRIAVCPIGLLIFGSRTGPGTDLGPLLAGLGRSTGRLIGFGMIIWCTIVVFGMIFCGPVVFCTKTVVVVALGKMTGL